jgi:hypothetical protein
MDAQMDMGRFYELDDAGKPVAIKVASKPFSIEDIKTCAHCRGSLRAIARYGRLVRRALLDESTKKLILALNGDYVLLAQEVPDIIQQLQDTKVDWGLRWPTTITISGAREDQCQTMTKLMKSLIPGRWNAILATRERVNHYCQKVERTAVQPSPQHGRICPKMQDNKQIRLRQQRPSDKGHFTGHCTQPSS